MIQILSAEQAKLFMQAQSHYLIDVREYHEWQLGYLEGATLVSKNDLLEYVEQQSYPHEQALILYCVAGIRAKWAAQQLLHKGYNNLYVLWPGYLACKQAGFKITTVMPE